MASKRDIEELLLMQEQLKRESRTDLLRFTFSTMPNFNPAAFHRRYYNILTRFAFGEFNKLMVFMPPQHGKELSNSTLVPTPSGFVKHGDLKVGDEVFGADGHPVRVLWVSPKTQSEYVVTFSDGQRIECHGNHEWVVFDRSYNMERTLETKYMASQRLYNGEDYRFSVNPIIGIKCEESTVRESWEKAFTVAREERSIVGIERKDGLEQGNCIQVEGGVYLVGDTFIPTHNSEGSTRRLPAFMLGLNPDTRIAVVSYNSPKARKFNREIQRIIDTPEYREIFQNTMLNGKNVTTISGSWLRNADECEIVGHMGGFKTVGVGGPLTGDPVDVLIMDDIYKDAASAWSSTVRANIQDWYDTVAETRLHNDSRQLIVFTRWHEDDLAGQLLRQQGVYDEEKNPDGWVVVVYQAIKEGEPTEYDPRQPGEALWPERHSLHKLELIRQRNPHVFQSLYQQKPTPKEGLMYHDFNTYKELPEEGVDKCCSDPADTGSDFLCSIFYREYHGYCFVTDVYYTQDDMDVTEPEMARRLARNGTKECIIEANNAGRLYANNVERRCREQGNTFTRFDTFWQTENKAVRIYSNSNAVNNVVVMPEGWEKKWPQYHAAMMGFLKVGANPNDDAPDCTTLLVEHMNQTNKDISGFFF